MTKAKNGPAKVKGAVLIMILAVMTVMIILLAGSIAVVYSTHERVTAKYQESQAYYTMRSTLDVCMATMIDNKDPADPSQKKYSYQGGTDPIKELTAADDELQRGAVEELVLFQVPVCTETSNPNANNYNQWYKMRTDEGVITDPLQVNMTAAELNNAGSAITGDSDFNRYKAQYASPAWTGSMVKGVDDVITYEMDYSSIASMSVDDSGKALTKMLDNVGDGSVIVKYQVIERLYDLGSGSTFGERFVRGDRKKDYFRVKATCEITIDGELQTYTEFFSTKEPDKINDSVSSLSSTAGGDALRIIGEANSLSNMEYRFQQDGMTSDNITFFGDVVIPDTGDGQLVLESGKIFMAPGTIDLGDNPKSIKFAEEGGIIYCENLVTGQQAFQTPSGQGNIICSDTYKIKHQGNGTTMDLRVIANNLEYTFNNPPNNILFEGPNYYNDVTINYVDPRSSNQYVTITGSQIVYKQALCNLVGDCTIAGDLVFKFTDYSVSPPADIELRYTIGGSTPAYTMTADPSITNPITLVTGMAANERIEADYSADTVYNPSTFMRTLTLPTTAVLAGGSNMIELKTQKSVYKDYFIDGSWDDTTGEFLATDQAFLYSHLNPRDSLPASISRPLPSGGTIEVPKDPLDPNGDTTPVSFTSIITPDSGVLRLEGDYSGSTCFDTREGDITVVFKNKVYGDFYVVGDNTLRIYLDASEGRAPGSRIFEMSQTNDAHVFSLIDYNTINVDTGNINMVNGKPYGPRTQLYVADDSSGNPLVDDIRINNQSASDIICGHFNAPKSAFHVSSADSGMAFTVVLPSGYTFSSTKFVVLGSILSFSVDMGAKKALWCMSPADPPGKKEIVLTPRYR